MHPCFEEFLEEEESALLATLWETVPQRRSFVADLHRKIVDLGRAEEQYDAKIKSRRHTWLENELQSDGYEFVQKAGSRNPHTIPKEIHLYVLRHTLYKYCQAHCPEKARLFHEYEQPYNEQGYVIHWHENFAF